jgi:type IV secretion system protein VirD4
MIQELLKVFLHLTQWFFSQPPLVGVVVFGSAAIVLFTIQFVHRKSTVIPGVFAIVFSFATFYHVFDGPGVNARIDKILFEMNTPRFTLSPLPGIVESFFSFAVAPLSHRSLVEEILFVVLMGYLGLVAKAAIEGYRLDGLVFGSLSLRNLFGSDVKRPTRSDGNELGSANMAGIEQLHRWTKASGEMGDTALYLKGVRGTDGKNIKVLYPDSKLMIPAGERNRHILMVAKTGGGKTTSLILPVLYNDCLDPDRSTIVMDSKPEMWQYLAGLVKKHNPKKRIILFNPLDMARSMSWNILGKIEDETDCKLIANTIIMATDNPQSKSDSPFFRNSALSLLNGIMVGLLKDPKETLSMPRVHELVQSGMKSLCDWLEQHPGAIRTTKTFVELARSGSQNADTIMSELSQRISAWDLPAIRATTAINEFDVESLISEPTLCIVELRESEIEMLRPLANVIVVELLRFLTKRAEKCPKSKLPRPVGFVIDEFASALGRLPDIHVKLNTLRSRNVSIVAAIQSIAQVKANYGDDADSVLAGFSTKIFMPNLDQQDSEWASKETGQMTVRFKTASTGTNKKLTEVFASNNDSSQEQVQQRAVLTQDEIGRPPDNIATFFLPNTPVFQAHLIPWFKLPELKSRIEESLKTEVELRSSPIPYEDKAPEPSPTPAAGAAGAAAAAAPGALPAGISDTRGWSDDQVRTKLEEIKKGLEWENTTGSARKWWEAFETENKHRLALVLRLAEELANRKATITEFFLAYVYSNTDNIQANLHYLDYTRLKKEEEKRKREASGGSAVAA